MSASNRAKLYLVASYFGTLATAILIFALALEWPSLVTIMFALVLLVSLLILLRRKLRDEYCDELWKAGASLAFAATIVCFLFVPFVDGFIDGLIDVEKGSYVLEGHAGLVAITAFFIGFHLKRVAGMR